MNAEIREQEKLNLAEEKDFRREELLGKYIVKMLYRQNSRKFKNKYLRKLERNQQSQKEKDKTIWENKPTSSSGSRNLEGGGNVRLAKLKHQLFCLIFLFHFYFILFSIYGLRIRVKVMISYCHISVTSDDMVTVTVTSHKVIKKSIEDFGKIML